MSSARSNFAAISLNTMIYVFGGLSDRSGSHNPVLAKTQCERFDVNKNVWENLDIKGAPSVFGFGWARISYEEIAIFGGSDGNLIVSDLYIVNFKSEKAEEKNVEGAEG